MDHPATPPDYDDDDDQMFRDISSTIDNMQGYDSDSHSPDNMLTDPDEYVVEQPDDEGDDVAEIDPDQLDGEVLRNPRADDCEFTTLLYCSCALTDVSMC